MKYTKKYARLLKFLAILFNSSYHVGISYSDRQWEGGDKRTRLAQDIRSSAHLTEFAAFCVAASVKNHNIEKSVGLYFSTFVLQFLIIPFKILYQNQMFLGSDVAAMLALSLPSLALTLSKSRTQI